MPATVPHRPHALALGLILPLSLAGAASAQQQGAASRTAWVDPPPRASAPTPGAAEATSRPASSLASNPAAPRRDAAEAVRDQAGARTQERTGQDPNRPGRNATHARQAARPESGNNALPKAAATRSPGPKRAAALERPSSRGTPHRHPYPSHHYAERPAAPVPAPAVVGARVTAARALTADYLATVSGPGDAMVGAANRFYATRVRFYGRPITTAGLAAEKRSFVQRWPVRRYEPRAMSTACDAETCTIRTLVDFRTANPERGAVSSGEAELILEVGFAGVRPYIIGETGRVLRRSLQAGTLAPSPGKA